MPTRSSTRLFVGLLLVAAVFALGTPAWAQEYEIVAPSVVLADVPFDVSVSAPAVATPPAQLQMRADGGTFDAERLTNGSYLVSGVTVSALGPVAVVFQAVEIAAETELVVP